MGKVKRLELWWQLYVTSLPGRDERNIRPLDFCWAECTITHHQERKQLYLQHLVFVTPYRYLLLSWKIWNFFECAVSCVRHQQHTQTSSNSSTISADYNNGVTITRCCRYICLRSWWWVMIPPETSEQFPIKINCVIMHLVGYILESYDSLSNFVRHLLYRI